MFSRFICLFLVFSMPTNQGLCFVHTHRGTDVAEPIGHSARPHFHSDGHRHRSTHNHDDHAVDFHQSHSDCGMRFVHRDPDHEPQIRPVADHDADAVYCYYPEAVTPSQEGRTVTLVSADCSPAESILRVSDDDWLLRLTPLLGQPPRVLEAACPVYLRTLSLRI